VAVHRVKRTMGRNAGQSVDTLRAFAYTGSPQHISCMPGGAPSEIPRQKPNTWISVTPEVPSSRHTLRGSIFTYRPRTKGTLSVVL